MHKKLNELKQQAASLVSPGREREETRRSVFEDVYRFLSGWRSVLEASVPLDNVY